MKFPILAGNAGSRLIVIFAWKWVACHKAGGNLHQQNPGVTISLIVAIHWKAGDDLKHHICMYAASYVCVRVPYHASTVVDEVSSTAHT